MNEQPEKGWLVFVAHKHQATTLRYDFCLEIGDMMRASAIPKEPTLDPQLKRQASPTTYHTLDYRHFEGALEEGQKGAGPVMVWNEGTYTPQREFGKGILEEVNERSEAEALMQQGLAAGMLKFRLFGHTTMTGSGASGPTRKTLDVMHLQRGLVFKSGKWGRSSAAGLDAAFFICCLLIVGYNRSR